MPDLRMEPSEPVAKTNRSPRPIPGRSDRRPRSGGGSSPTWSTWREALQVVAFRPHLARTIRTALVVGTILFCINQLNVVLEGKADVAVWVKVGITFLVPFCVSNVGILIATRRDPAMVDEGADQVDPPPGR